MQSLDQSLMSKLPQAQTTPQAETIKRVNRQVVITTTYHDLVIGFYWREIENGVMSDIKDTSFQYPLEVNLESIERALNYFLAGGASLAIETRGIIVCSRYLDDIATKFDMVANSAEPAQTLVSRYIL